MAVPLQTPQCYQHLSVPLYSARLLALSLSLAVGVGGSKLVGGHMTGLCVGIKQRLSNVSFEAELPLFCLLFVGQLP